MLVESIFVLFCFWREGTCETSTARVVVGHHVGKIRKVLPATSTFSPHQFAVLKWYECVCVCVCALARMCVCVRKRNLKYLLCWLIHISSFCTMPVYTHKHMHACIRIPFEDSKLMGLKVDIAVLPRVGATIRGIGEGWC